MRTPVRSTKGSITGHDCRDAGGRATQEQLPRTAREDVDAGDARRVRAMEGPNHKYARAVPAHPCASRHLCVPAQ